MKQTAVEWLVDNLEQNKFITKSQIHIAKEKFEQQIMQAYQQGFNNAYFNNPLSKEQYYNETFNK
jgi:hypothetical protein